MIVSTITSRTIVNGSLNPLLVQEFWIKLSLALTMPSKIEVFRVLEIAATPLTKILGCYVICPRS